MMSYAFEDIDRDYSRELKRMAYDMADEFRSGKHMSLDDFAKALREIEPALTDEQVKRLFSFGMHVTR